MRHPKFNPAAYIRNRARQLPLGECYISRPVVEAPSTVCAVTRIQPSGKLMVGLYIVDNYGRGLCECLGLCNKAPEDLPDLLWQFKSLGEMRPTTYAEVHNKIYAGLEFAEEAGLRPHPDWQVARFILEEDEDTIPLEEVNLGWKGIHLFMAFNDREAANYKKTVEKHLAPDEFAIVVQDEDREIGYRTYYGNPLGFTSKIVIEPASKKK